MNILLLEDDDNWAKRIEARLKDAFPGATITLCGTEWSFRKLLENRPLPVLDAAIFDIMVRWADYHQIMEHKAMEDVPSEVEGEFEGREKWRAGVRCRKLLAGTYRTCGLQDIPCVYFTVLDQDDLKNDLGEEDTLTPVIHKFGDGREAGLSGLVDALKQRLPQTV